MYQISQNHLKKSQPIYVFLSYASEASSFFKITTIAEKLTELSEIKDVIYWETDTHEDIVSYMNDNIT
ncbi:MAG: hypothetical protein ACTSQ8_18495 [Candidatus Helarchaeota archaeon]